MTREINIFRALSVFVTAVACLNISSSFPSATSAFAYLFAEHDKAEVLADKDVHLGFLYFNNYEVVRTLSAILNVTVYIVPRQRVPRLSVLLPPRAP